MPDPNQGRSSQIFRFGSARSSRERPFCFARRSLRVRQTRTRGMSKETFEATREFLIKNNNILTQTQDAQLGYALDSRYYNIPDYVTYMRDQLTKLTVEDVNNAIRKYLKSDAMRIVMITKDAEGLREAIVSNKPSPITYNSPKPKKSRTKIK